MEERKPRAKKNGITRERVIDCAFAELKENVHAGQQASVFIKSILPNRMKVKLVLVECFDYTYKPEPPVYFFQGDHIDKFTYSPPECAKHIETVFA